MENLALNGTGNAYNNWTWKKDPADNSLYSFYRDGRFETTVGVGMKQAFALSWGDVHGAIGVP
ncbi:hypothetical protein FACS1894193_06540 [Bacilli bacterium]|nr:hypothetical protein FACS1894192_12570 [Bacilli bacterium]GHU41917.1 hypothetical protein FACS1894193_06540 [Bacilli bacterium]